jgi:hypothetical protein
MYKVGVPDDKLYRRYDLPRIACFQTADNEFNLPDKRLLILHAVSAKVARRSGAVAYIDKMESIAMEDHYDNPFPTNKLSALLDDIVLLPPQRAFPRALIGGDAW